MRALILLAVVMSGCIPSPGSSPRGGGGIEEIPPMPIKVSAPVEPTPIQESDTPEPLSPEISGDAHHVPVPEEDVQPPSGEPSSSAEGEGPTQTDPPSVETATSPSVDAGGESKQKPLVTCYSSQYGVHCPGCIRAKQWWERLSDKDRADLPFTVRFTGEVPNWVEAVPCFHWNAAGKSYMSVGWKGPEHLIQSYENSFVQPAASVSVFMPMQSACGAGGCRMRKR